MKTYVQTGFESDGMTCDIISVREYERGLINAIVHNCRGWVNCEFQVLSIIGAEGCTVACDIHAEHRNAKLKVNCKAVRQVRRKLMRELLRFETEFARVNVTSMKKFKLTNTPKRLKIEGQKRGASKEA